MDELQTLTTEKKRQLDELRPLSGKILAVLEHYYDIELTYTSNAIEGNTLTRVETSIVIEKRITVSGKSLKDHVEAVDHYHAVRYARLLMTLVLIRGGYPPVAVRPEDRLEYIRSLAE